MTQNSDFRLPDIGDFVDVEVIEIHVEVGSTIEVEDPIITVESDKASMDIPSTAAGVVTEIKVEIGSKINQGDHILSFQAVVDTSDRSDDSLDLPTETPSIALSKETAVLLPDIGDFSDVEVIEIHVEVGSTIAVEDPIITVESDKASMDVPASIAGEVTSVLVELGSTISAGDHILNVVSAHEASHKVSEAPTPEVKTEPQAQVQSTKLIRPAPIAQAPVGSPAQSNFSSPHAPPPTLPPPVERAKETLPHASPGVRRFARELGADLSEIRGTGAKGRILREDVKIYVKQTLSNREAASAVQHFGPPPLPEIDFTNFGEVETVKISKIKLITGDRLHRSWLDIPHVTHHDEVDISELDQFRKAVDNEERKKGTRVTILSFVCKAVISALQKFPNFNSSLSPDRQSLILKKYINIGVAVDTANGLVVPVIRNINNLSVLEIAESLQTIGENARQGKLTPADFQGGCFTISSLGGIGGRFFTPIINPPEVAILGVSRHHLVSFPAENSIEWKKMLPLSLSYDHRVIDGAEAARFSKYLCELLYDSRRMLL